MPTQTVISINRQTPIMGPATFYPRVVVKRLPFLIQMTAELLCDYRCQSVNSETEICITAGNVIIADFGQVYHRAY